MKQFLLKNYQIRRICINKLVKTLICYIKSDNRRTSSSANCVEIYMTTTKAERDSSRFEIQGARFEVRDSRFEVRDSVSGLTSRIMDLRPVSWRRQAVLGGDHSCMLFPTNKCLNSSYIVVIKWLN